MSQLHLQVNLDLCGGYLRKNWSHLDLHRYFPMGHLYLWVQVAAGQVTGCEADTLTGHYCVCP
jgi:hypothetical protein